MPIVGPIPNVVCPRDGSKWYSCKSGSMFVGCCKLNPCKFGCQDGYVGSPLFTETAIEILSKLPDASCSAESNFYSCNLGDRNGTYLGNQTYYWGCCKTNACAAEPAPGCPTSELGMTFLRYSKALDKLEEKEELPDANVVGPVASAPPTTLFETTPSTQVGRYDARILITLCFSLLVVLPATVLLWLGYRKMFPGSKRAPNKANNLLDDPSAHSDTIPLSPIPTGSEEASKDDCHTSAPHDALRMGPTAIYLLSATSLVIIGVCAFLAFLWFGDNATWKSIMVRNWATRSVSVSALLLRTAVDFQAAIVSAMLVALLLESQTGVNLYHLADVSPMRTGANGPWSLGKFISLELWHSARTYKRNYKWVLVTIGLLTTTVLVQFSSTILLSDLESGLLGGYDSDTEIRPGLSYKDVTRRITRDTAWTSNPPSYPAFGEYTEQIPTKDGVSDTGMVLRAFLPYATAETRQTVRSYLGQTLVLDARVSCQAPKFFDFNGTDHYAETTGMVNITKSVSGLQNIFRSSFACQIAGPDEFSICQLGQTFPGFIGSLNSSFENSTSYGTAFLVSRGSNSRSKKLTGMGSEWLDLKFANQTDLGASFSICFAPWDSSILDVTITSESNRTEPLLHWWRRFSATEVVNQLLPNSSFRTERPVLRMEKPRSFLGEVPPLRERPLVQSDASGSSAAEYGSNTPLPENWSVFLTGEPLITLLNHFSRAPARSISADPALAAIFNDTMNETGSVAWAMSSLITVLSMTNYYSQLPAFDRLDTVQVSFFENVLYPQDNLGFVLLMWTLVAHYIIVVIVVVSFVSKTRLTLLGNSWMAFSQMATSPDIREYIGDGGLKGEETVLEELKGKTERLRARLVKRGDGVEFVVE